MLFPWQKQHSNSPDESTITLRSIHDDENDGLVTKPSVAPRNWTQGMRLCTYLALSILVIDIIFMVVASVIAYSKTPGLTFSNSPVLLHGKCSTTKGATIGLHLVINVLSTALLGACNYCMQGLAAPDRAAVDKAHSQGRWLDIGTSSIRNVRALGWRQTILWVVLWMTSIPIHMLYNSVIFSSLGVNDYEILLTSKDYNLGAPGLESPPCWSVMTWIIQDFPSVAAQVSQGQFRNLSASQCRDSLSQQFVPGRRTVLVQVNYNNTYPEDMILYGGVGGVFGNLNSYSMWKAFDDAQADHTVHAYPFATTVYNVSVPYLGGNLVFSQENGSDPANTMEYQYDFNIPPALNETYEDYETLLDLLQYSQHTSWKKALLNASNWNNATWASEVTITPNGTTCNGEDVGYNFEQTEAIPIESCLFLDSEEHCEMLYSPITCLVVILCNGVKVVCMLLAMREKRQGVFLTTGDALASFLERPDPSTRGFCLLSRANVDEWSRAYTAPRMKASYWPISPSQSQPGSSPPPAVLPNQRRWASAVSLWNWGLTIAYSLLALGAASGFLVIGLRKLSQHGQSINFKALWDMGLGTPGIPNLIPFDNILYPYLSQTVLANSPQILLSGAYFLYNRALTSMLLSVEYTEYANRRKALRVSWPAGSQRSTYFLTLPYRYSIPFMIAFILLHWLVSESFFYALVQTYDLGPEGRHEAALSNCFWSPIALVFALGASFLLLLAILAIGCMPLKSNMPLARNCSAAMSAACHPPPGDIHAATKRVMWGEVRIDNKFDGPDRLNTIDDDSVGIHSSIMREEHDSYSHCSFTSEEVVPPSNIQLYEW